MIVPELFHYINDSICFLIGVPLNALLMWLIVKKSPSEMGQYRPILLLATFIDIVYLIDFLLVIPVGVVDGGYCGLFSLGLLGSVPIPWSCAVVMTWIFLIAFREVSIAVPFIYRYCVICYEKTWGLSHFLAMLLVPIFLSIEHVCLCYYCAYVPSVEDQLAANQFFGFPTDSNKTYTIPLFIPSHVGSIVIALNLGLFTSVNYILIVIFGWRLYRHLNAITGLHSSQVKTGNETKVRVLILNFQEHARMLNTQISTTLFLQAAMPLVVECLPMAEILTVMISGANLASSTLYIVPILAWIPVLNPLVTMWVVRAYRREILAWIEHICGKIATVPTTIPMSTRAHNGL